ncbi:hypothetical protein [Streptomyces fructofermentans]|uniref:hypothetical protein n=1 Tax=Streptomyces fructofermentans TaxID=152141 RepID=UPI001674FA10|nr:hypothetical protein [Streptomyces fructofermentans]
MPRGRHRHSPPLHRLLPASTIAGVSVVCATGPWLFSDMLVLRGLAAAAAGTAVLGAVVMRRWDASAGRRVADLTRARASDEWRFEERVAELESDLDESRELRTKLEQKLRAKRAELAGLRNEHASLLRRYATAETERATALEGRRLLEIEATAPVRPALPPARSAVEETVPAGAVETTPEPPAVPEATAATVQAALAASSAASVLYVRANAALDRLTGGAPGSRGTGPAHDSSHGGSGEDTPEGTDGAGPSATDIPGPDGHPTGEGDPPRGGTGRAGSDSADGAAGHTGASEDGSGADRSPKGGTAGRTAKGGTLGGSSTSGGPGGAPARGSSAKSTPAKSASPKSTSAAGVTVTEDAGQEDGPRGNSEAVGGHERTAATAATPRRSTGTARVRTRTAAADAADAAPEGSGEEGPGAVRPGGAPTRSPGTALARPTPSEVARVRRRPAGDEPAAGGTAAPGPAPRASRPSGHFTVPTAVAVVPASPSRRPSVQGGFDFFGTQEEEPLEAVQNEDLADVVGEEALAVHKAEAEAEFKPATEESRAVGQVIDLTEHDETEHVDLKQLRSAVS